MSYLKRLAICSNAISHIAKVHNQNVLHILLEGQVLDIPFEDKALLKDENWDYDTGLPYGDEAKNVTAFDDLRANRVRSPILDFNIYSERKSFNRKKLLTLTLNVNNADGVFDIEKIQIPADFGTKSEIVELYYEIIYKGTDSLRQRVYDVSNSSKIQLGDNGKIGSGKIYLLPENYNGIVLTSDIDQTYLNTDLSTTRGKVKTLFETYENKGTLPGMSELYRELTGHFKKTNPSHPLFVKFISASPFFFRRVMSQVFQKETVPFDSIHLKDLQGILNNLFFDSLSSLTNFNRLFEKGMPSLQRASAFLEPYIHNFFDQTGYKLILLLKSRISYPKSVQEILIGDNTETDFLIFMLYKKILEDKDTPQDWNSFFQKFSFNGKKVLTQQQIDVIVRQIVQVREYLAQPQLSVPLVLIHNAENSNNVEKIRNIFTQYNLYFKVNQLNDKDDAVVDMFICENALQMAEVLIKRDLLTQASYDVIKSAMLGKRLRDVRIDQNYFRTVEQQKKL